eukprot:TRINITY_DN25539_c0_g1_i4.p1 TRINITY_DN25539_c0_g1~~TRINITY_DN25539_c0_g1_i4.p1  ORF type:complete len:577 (-),score=90.07 TRINITY_DN25539_c0_g1_i4:124-1854(-)
MFASGCPCLSSAKLFSVGMVQIGERHNATASPKAEYPAKGDMTSVVPGDPEGFKVDDSDSSDEDALTAEEQRGWYMYDWSNSPYYQVYVAGLMPIYLKWLAEGAAARSAGIDIYKGGSGTDVDASLLAVPGLSITAGSFPPLVGWITTVVQVVFLLSFSVFGDFGELRSRLMRFLTWMGSFILLLHVFCTSDSTWWFAALLRVMVGVCFVLAQTYYNAYLPVLVQADRDVAALAQTEDGSTKSMEVSDTMSHNGQMIGYLGGLVMLVASTIVLVMYECAEDCSEAEVFFWPAMIIAAVGIWWTVFSMYTFKVLKPRSGEDFPDEGSMLCFGWRETFNTCSILQDYKNTYLFIIAYFLFSDAASTFCVIALLILDDESSSDGHKSLMSAILFNCILAAVGAFVGIFIFMRIQRGCGISNKSMLCGQLAFWGILSVAGGCGLIKGFDGAGFYMVMAPAMLLNGSVQSYSRSVLASLIPKGKESSIFAFYEISDKGSNAIGTLATAVVHIWLHSYMPMFWFIALEFLLAAICLMHVDRQAGQRAARGDAKGGRDYDPSKLDDHSDLSSEYTTDSSDTVE